MSNKTLKVALNVASEAMMGLNHLVADNKLQVGELVDFGLDLTEVSLKALGVFHKTVFRVNKQAVHVSNLCAIARECSHSALKHLKLAKVTVG